MAAPKLRSDPLTVDLPDEAATAALARDLAARARPGDVIALAGDLGSGKTSFARAFINALPRPGTGAPAGAAEEVPSPTFTLVQIYDRDPAPVWHLDLYRLERPEDAYELGLEEALGGAILLIEWPERLGPLLPRGRPGGEPGGRLDLHFAFAQDPGARRVELAGGGDWPGRLENLDSAPP